MGSAHTNAIPPETIIALWFVVRTSVATPFIVLVTGVTVEGTIMRHYRARKIIVYKMQPKKKTRKKRGHRQEMTRLMIDSISVNGAIIAEAAKAEAVAVAA